MTWKRFVVSLIMSTQFHVQKNQRKNNNKIFLCACICAQRVWDELDVWHSCLAALEVDMQDLEKPEDTLTLTEKLVEVQQFHSQLAKQAEQRTTLLSKVRTTICTFLKTPSVKSYLSYALLMISES